MLYTTIDLYRRGSASSPRFAKVRVPLDIPTVIRGREEWVEARSGGVSTFSTSRPGKTWWRLLEGSPYAEVLYIHNDHGDHYNWEPAKDMPLSSFISLLQDVEHYFHRLLDEQRP